MIAWKPQYEQFGQWHNMTLDSITLELMPGGKIKAHGTDQVGEFTFDGCFNKTDNNFKFLKSYVGQHQIFYEGVFDKFQFAFRGNWGFNLGGNQGGFRMTRKSQSN